jgi:hypothetical protein
MAAGALRDTCAVSCSATLSHGVGGKTEGMTGHSLQDAGVRPLTDSERALLDAFLRYDFQGVEELRTQVGQLRASSGCTCGCGTLDLHIDDVLPRSSGDGPVPVEGTVVSADGQPTGGGLLLFVEDGRLSGLEVYSLTDDSLPMPDLEHVRW